MALEHARRPFASDADTAGDADRLVDDEQLSVIARHETEPGPESGAIESLDVDAGARELADKSPRRAAYANPIEEQSDGDAACSRSREGVAEAMPDLIGAEDVALERY